MKKFAAVLGALALAGIGTTGAQAQSATGTLTFLQPTGIVGPTDVIPIDVRLTLAGNSSTLTVVDNLITSGGPSEQELTDRGFDVSGPYFVGLSASALCAGSFFPPNACGPAPYEFSFFDNGNLFPANFTLQAGESIDFTFGLFTPQVGGAPNGSYNFYTANVLITAYRFDVDNNYIDTSFVLASSCDVGDSRCAFTRTVQGVPEPGTWALMIGGFGLAGSALRRRRAALA